MGIEMSPKQFHSGMLWLCEVHKYEEAEVDRL